MKNIDIKNFIHQILSYNWIGNVRLDDLISDIIENSDEIATNEKEVYFESLADIHSKDFKRIIFELNQTIKENIDCPIIVLNDEADGFYIKRIRNDNLKLYDKVIKKIESFDKLKKNKGIRFEKFCIDFLNDIGIESSSTRVSNDKGIDIKGKYKTKLNGTLGSFIRYDYVYILAQAKYYSNQIDTPVIRKLVGDSIFIRFDDLEYIEIKHNALHLIVFSRRGFTKPAAEFAIKNKIELFDSHRIAHLISNNPNKTWLCID